MREQSNSSSRAGRLTLLAFVLPLAVSSALLFSTLTQQPLWGDEIVRLQWARGHDSVPVVDADPRTLGRNVAVKDLDSVLPLENAYGPPLHGVLLNLWIRLTGANDDFRLKAMFALFGILATLAGVLAGRELGGPGVGLVTGLLCAVSPFHVRYIEEVNHYAPALCFTAFTYFFFLRLVRTTSVFAALGLAVSAVLGLYSHYFVALAVASCGLAMLPWLARVSWRARAVLLSPFVLICAGFGPYLPTMKRQLGGLTDPVITGQFGGMPYFVDQVRSSPSWLWLGELAERLGPTRCAMLGVVMLVIAVLGIRAHADAKIRWALAVLLVLPSLIVWSAYWARSNNTYLWTRYTVFFSLTTYLPVALAIAQTSWPVRVVAAGVSAVAMAFGLKFLLVDFRKEDWRSTAKFIDERIKPGEQILVFPPSFGPDALTQYLEAPNHITSLPNMLSLKTFIDEVAHDKPGVFVVGGWSHISPVTSVSTDLLRCRYSAEESRHLTRIEVYHFHRGPPTAGEHATPVCRNTNGFERPPLGCVSDGAAPLTVRGWVDLTTPDDRVEVVSAGRPSQTPALEPAPDGGLRRSFDIVVDVSAAGQGTVQNIAVRLASPGQEPRVLGETLNCLRRPAFLDNAWPGVPVERAILSPVEGGMVGKPLRLDGWAYSSAGLRAFRVLVDDVEVMRTREHGIRAEDVAGAFPDVTHDLAAYSRFNFTVDSSALQPGEHTIRLEAEHADGGTSPLGQPRVFGLVAAD